MKTRIRPYIRPAIVLAGAAGFLALFLTTSDGLGGQTVPIVVAVGGVAVLAAFLIVLITYAQRQDRRVRRVVQPEPDPAEGRGAELAARVAKAAAR